MSANQRLFEITTQGNNVIIPLNGNATASYNVTNVSGRYVRGKAEIVPLPPEAAAWITLQGEQERMFPIGGTNTYDLTLAPPAGTPPGSYNFAVRLDVVNSEAPDDSLHQGQVVNFTAIVPEPDKPREPVKIPIPLIIGIIVALVVIVLVIVLLTRGSDGFDFVDQANTAAWTRTDGITLTFGNCSDANAHACQLPSNSRLADGSTCQSVKCLETLPPTGGMAIQGRYEVPRIEQNQFFLSQLIFKQGMGASDGVSVEILFNDAPIFTTFLTPSTTRTNLAVSLASLAGQEGTVTLSVGSSGTNANDLLVWVNPRIAAPPDANDLNTQNANSLNTLIAATQTNAALFQFTGTWFRGAINPGRDITGTIQINLVDSNFEVAVDVCETFAGFCQTPINFVTEQVQFNGTSLNVNGGQLILTPEVNGGNLFVNGFSIFVEFFRQ